MKIIKIILSIFFLLLGLVCAILTYNLSNKDSLGVASKGNRTIENIGTGIDSSNDGVAVGLGIISGFSFLSSVMLITSINKSKE